MATSARRDSGARVAVFAKAPVPGEVKTRLIGLLGAREAAGLHAALVRRALGTARNSAVGPVSLWCMPDTGHPFFAACAAEYGAELRPQRGGDLGERMEGAFGQLLGEGPAVLIGSDCPCLGVEDLRSAAAALATHDAVLQPAEDGGYVLVGLSRQVPGLFDGVRWGESTVMRETRERLRSAGATWKELPVRWDVDRPEDYRRLAQSGLLAEARG